jgi:hypothetical protein
VDKDDEREEFRTCEWDILENKRTRQKRKGILFPCPLRRYQKRRRDTYVEMIARGAKCTYIWSAIQTMQAKNATIYDTARTT